MLWICTQFLLDATLRTGFDHQLNIFYQKLCHFDQDFYSNFAALNYTVPLRCNRKNTFILT